MPPLAQFKVFSVSFLSVLRNQREAVTISFTISFPAGIKYLMFKSGCLHHGAGAAGIAPRHPQSACRIGTEGEPPWSFFVGRTISVLPCPATKARQLIWAINFGGLVSLCLRQPEK
jgi:hypothetical protein